MIVSLLTFVYLYYIARIIKSKNENSDKLLYLFMLIVSCECLNNSGYVFISNNAQFIHVHLCLEMLFLAYVCYLIIYQQYNIVLKTRMIAIAIIFLLVVLLGIVIEYLFPSATYIVIKDDVLYNGSSWDSVILGSTSLTLPKITLNNFKEYLHIIIYVIIITIFKSTYNSSFVIQTINILRPWCYLNLVIGPIEFVIKNVLDFHEDYTGYLAPFLSGQTIQLSQRGDYYSLSGFSWEPSGYSTGIFLSALFLIAFYYKYKENDIHKKIAKYLMLPLVVFDFLMSGSFSSLLYLTFLIFVLAYIRIKKCNSIFDVIVQKKNIYMTLLSVLLIVVVQVVSNEADVFKYLEYRLNGLMEIYDFITTIGIDKMPYQESVPRIYAITESLDTIVEYPFWGLGLGTSFSYTGTLMNLENIGFIGVGMWCALIMYGLKYRDNVILFLLLIAGAFTECYNVGFYYPLVLTMLWGRI